MVVGAVTDCLSTAQLIEAIDHLLVTIFAVVAALLSGRTHRELRHLKRSLPLSQRPVRSQGIIRK